MGTKLIRFCAATIMALGASVPGFAKTEACKIRFGIEGGVIDFTPVSAFHRTQPAFVEGHVANRLLSIHRKGKIILRGASFYEINKDEQTITFNLNPTCRWSDGAVVTAQDYLVGISNALLMNNGDFMPSIRGIETFMESGNQTDLEMTALATDKLKIGYEGASDLLLINLGANSMIPVPTHTGLSPAEYFAQPLEERIASGVYTVKERLENMTVLEPNPYYCATNTNPPVMQTVELHEIDDSDHRIRKFAREEIDVLRFLPVKQLQGMMQRNKNLKIHFLPSNALAHVLLLVNAQTSGLSDPRVRQAVELSLDFRSFLEADQQNPTQTRLQPKGYVLTFPPYVNRAMQKYFVRRKPDLTKARSLMEAAGYSQENPLEISITTYPIPGYVTTARRVASMLSRSHFKVKYHAQDTTTAALEANAAGNFDLFIRGASPAIPDSSAVLTELWTMSAAVILKGMTPRPENIQYIWERMPLLLEKTRLNDQSNSRIAAMVEAENLFREAKVIIPLFDMVRNLTAHAEFSEWGDGFEASGGNTLGQYWTKEGCE